MSYAAQWAESHGLVLDTTLTLHDAGLSAFHQRHVASGALGTFLRAIDEGMISPGSVLVVEGLDRLSRAEPLQAQAQLTQIINAGITVVTASDGREYNREAMRAQPMELVYSLLVMIRAHEESATKSTRVKAQLHSACKRWIAGDKRVKIHSGHDPFWIHTVDGEHQLLEPQATMMRELVTLYLKGVGFQNAIKTVTAKLEYAGTKMPAASSLYKVVESDLVSGTKTLEVDGETYQLKEYYPALLDELTAAKLKAQKGSRTKRVGKTKIPGIITGIGITTCGYCGSAATMLNIERTAKKSGITSTIRRLVCSTYNSGRNCPHQTSRDLSIIERAILEFTMDSAVLTDFLEGDATKPLRKKLQAAQESLSDKQTRLNRLTLTLEQDSEDAPLSILRRVRSLEQEVMDLEERCSQMSAELAVASRTSVDDAGTKLATLYKSAMDDLDYNARIEARNIIKQTFSRIQVFMRSMQPESDSTDIDMALHSITGVSRLLRVSKAGEWQMLQLTS